MLIETSTDAAKPPKPAIIATRISPRDAKEPVRFQGNYSGLDKYQTDGRLPPVLGVHNYQVLRANRTHPEWSDGLGYTYNHAPMLAYWRGTFYLQYLCGPVHEQHPDPANRDAYHTMLMTSHDGRIWSKPQFLFPSFVLPDGRPTVAHQRMGFYVAPNRRLLTLGFYGRYPTPNDGKGIGRAVREIRADGSFGDIYFIRYNHHAGWNETNTPYPFYTASSDKGFLAACNALLADKLMTQQWWEEDRGDDGFFALTDKLPEFSAKAFAFARRKDGLTVGLWKGDFAALSADNGQTWTPPVRTPTVPTGGSKAWIQRTADGCYALAFNADNDHRGCRWPLALLVGDDGATFDRLLCVHGEMNPQRYAGKYKDIGFQYVRGIVEGNGVPRDRALWLTYSVNKEDLWVSRVPVPVRSAEVRPVRDDFARAPLGKPPAAWNVYCPLWAAVEVAELPDTPTRCLRILDRDPAAYAQATRLFPPSTQATIRFRLRAKQANNGQLEIVITTPSGWRATTLTLNAHGEILAQDGKTAQVIGAYAAEQWLNVEMRLNTRTQRYTVLLDGQTILNAAAFAESPHGQSIHALTFRTGARTVIDQLEPFRPYAGAGQEMPDTDEPTPPIEYFLTAVTTTDHSP
jgi:hypothetical protein